MAADPDPHILTIIDGAEGDWVVTHLDSCPKKRGGAMFDDVEGETEWFTCRMQYVLDGNGIDDIEDWRLLPPGDYLIESVYEYTPGEYGGSYGSESAVWLQLVVAEGVEAWTVDGVPDVHGSRRARYDWQVPRAVAEQVAAAVGGKAILA